MQGTERRLLPRARPGEGSAIALLEELPPHELPAAVVALAEEASGRPTALYVVDIGGSSLRLVGGGPAWPVELALKQNLGRELTRGRLGELQDGIDQHLPGAAVVPLWLHGRAVAVLVCDGEPREAVEPLARQAAAAVELADRYTDVFHRARRRRLTTPAAEIQENLLPPRFAQLSGAEIAAGIVPAYEVGGDWYDYAQNPEGAWIAVADAAGKGPRSAGSSTMALGALRAARRGGLGLAEAGRGMDLAVRQLAETTFVTAVLSRYDPAERTLTWLRFGHPYPLLLRADGTLELLEGTGHRPLGVLGEVDLEPCRVQLEPGDRVILTSDGVWERRTPDGGFFAEQGIRHAIENLTAPGAAVVATTLADAVVGANPEPPHDDATVVVLAI